MSSKHVAYLHVRRWDPSWPLGTVGWWGAACSGCSGCCGTWPCSWTGRKHPAGLQTASHTCWAISPTSSVDEQPVPSSDHFGGRKEDVWAHFCISVHFYCSLFLLLSRACCTIANCVVHFAWMTSVGWISLTTLLGTRRVQQQCPSHLAGCGSEGNMCESILLRGGMKRDMSGQTHLLLSAL